jgi:TldD protein
MLALDTARQRGALYADIRILRIRDEQLRTKNGQVAGVDRTEDMGFGIRVVADGAWGFSSSQKVTKEEIARVAAEAVKIAKASARVQRRPMEIAPEPPHVDRWSTPFEVDPFAVPLDEKIGLLLEVDAVLRSVSGVKIAEGSMAFNREIQDFASTEGSYIEQTILRSSVGYSATAVGKSDVQVRSYPTSGGAGQTMNKGYELIREWKLKENAKRIAEEAVALLTADQCPSGQKDIILAGDQLALQVHESCGHPIELDRVLGSEANYAGTSFLTVEKLRKLQYGSPIVHIVADSLSPAGCGTFGYDDEGVPAQRWDIVKDGLFVGYLTSRETAAAIGEKRSRATMRADGWNRTPIIRMNNVSLMPGTWKLDDLIADTEDGIYMETNRSWSIDQLRYNFQFGTELGWEIKNGKRTRMLKNCTYQGITPEFWNACDAICDDKHWVLWGTANCGKGEPGQIAATGHGAAPARFRKVKVGVGYVE